MTYQEASLPQNYIFESITLQNFKMHRYTELRLSEKPIIVISGANGSGKSQILEAIILSIGHIPSRVALGTQRELIGPFGKVSIISLTLNNPVIGEKRIFDNDDPELSSFLNEKESFIIEHEIRENQTIRRIKSIDKKEHIQVTKKQIKQLMKKIGIFDNTMLNFTEEGYLSSFAADTPHKKLDTLVNAVGMQEIYHSYFETKQKVEIMNKENSPLLSQLEQEKYKLKKMEDNFNLFKQKKHLLSRHQLILRELSWFNFEEVDKELKLINDKIRQYYNDKKKIEEEIKVNEAEKQDIKKNYQNLISLKHQKEQESYSLRASIERMNGEINEKVRIIEEKNNEIFKLKKRKEKIERMFFGDSSENKKRLMDDITSVVREINQLELKLKNNKERAVHLNEEKKAIMIKIQEKEKLLSSSKLTDYERNRIKDALEFKDAISKENYANEILGPLFQLIEVKDEYKKIEKPIKAALGSALFDFVATSKASYEAAKKVYDQLKHDLKYRPNIVVGRVISKSNKTEVKNTLTLSNKPQGLIDYAVNLINAPLPVIIYLKKFKRTVLAESYLPPNVLTDYAKSYSVNILTTDMNGYYLSREAFSRPPPVQHVTLKMDIKSYESGEKLRREKELIEKDIGLLTSERIELSQRIVSLKEEKEKIEQNLKMFEDDSIVDNSLLDIENSIEIYLKEIDSKREEINHTRERINSNQVKVNDLNEEISHLESEIDEIVKKQRLLSEEIANKNRKVKNLTELLAKMEEDKLTLSSQYDELNEIVKKVGERPEIVRQNKEDILAEKNELEGQLKLININPMISAEAVQEQKEKVSKLEELIEKSNVHLTNLKSDLNKRLNYWVSSLQRIVDHLNGTLKNLLSGAFANISVSINNFNDANKVELVIEAETKGDSRKYRQLSGGEKTLIAQAIILSLHLINYSPLHVIDEFVSTLDKKNVAYAFSMASTVHKMAKRNRLISNQFILITPNIEGVELTEEFTHKIIIETKVAD